MAVHFKFRSAVAFDSIPVEGTGITLANLKDKIVEQKNLGRSTNFDLVITNAESGEEYNDDTFLVPKNTSVIIKRVPARRAKTTLLVNEPEDDVSDHRPARPVNKDVDVAQLALISPIDELYDMDDFGVDLYAVDESALTQVEADETSIASAFFARTAMKERRSTQEISPIVHGKDALVKGFARGASYRAVPHAGYVCHRCGLPGHFIQHCPTNGDPAYDLKKGSRVRAEWEDLSTSLAVGGQLDNFVVKQADPLPPELQCSLCQGIFKEAVMIPCCQYSFCDTCARQYLLEKGSCPQCGSDKLKDSDLLPNVALRQAIDRFTSDLIDTAVPNEDFESATKAAKVLPSPTQLHKMSSTIKDVTSVVVVDNQPELPVVDVSVCESAIGSKEKAVNEGSKLGAYVGEASSVGRKKKKHARPTSISEMVSEHMASKSRKLNKLCYVCGSPDHIARNCITNAGDNSTCFPSQRGAFPPLGPVPPRTINPFGQEMYWPGPMPYSAPAVPVGPYGPVPYGTPALPVGPYGVSSFTPPLYPNPQMHGMLGPRERPLSREEFMELQERERRRRLTQNRRERELSEGRPFSVAAGSEDSLSSGSEHGFNKQWPPTNKLLSRRHDLDSNFSKELGSTRSKQKHSRKIATERVNEHLAVQRYNRESDEDLAYDDPRGLTSYAQRFPQGVKPVLLTNKKTNKIYECSPDSNYEEGQNANIWGVEEESQSKSKQIAFGRGDGPTFEKREHTSYVKHDGTRVSEAGAAEMLRSSRHRSKKAVLEGARFLNSDEPIQIAAVAKDRHNLYGIPSDDGDSIEVVKKVNTRKHHFLAKSVLTNDTSWEGVKKKRKHKKHKAEGSKETSVGDIPAEVGHKKLSKRHESSHTSVLVDKSSAEITAIPDDIEEGRWQMDDGLEDGPGNDNISHRDRSKRKHHRSSKSALHIE